MRILLLVSALALFAAAQWALDPTAGYRGWAVDAIPSLPVSFSADVQLLPTPYWQVWVLGNWTTAFVAEQGCTVRAGPLRYGIYVSFGPRITTPSVKLGQNFTIISTIAKRYPGTRVGGGAIHVASKGYQGRCCEILIAGDYVGIEFNVFVDPSNWGSRKIVWAPFSRDFATFAFVGMYVSSQDMYYMYIYMDGVLVSQGSFAGQRGGGGSDGFVLGGHVGGHVNQELLYVAFALYNRSLTAAEVAGWRPEAPVGGDLVMYYYAHPQFVKDVDGDGVLEWLDLSGNNRHAKLWLGATPQWFVEPVALQTQQCGGVSLTAQWDGFTATYAVNGTQSSAFEPGRVHFDGLTSYAVVPISFYGWQGLTIEQYIYVPPCKPNAAWSKASMYGNSWSANNTYIDIITDAKYCNYWLLVELGYKRPDGSARDVVLAGLGLGRWQHVVVTFNKTTMTARIYINGTLVSQGTWDYQYTIFDYSGGDYSRFVLGANIGGGEGMTISYSYVRIYSRELSADEVRQNMQSPNSPTARGLEVWLHWDSFRGNTWLDKSGKGRNATVYGNTYSYPHWQWTVGAYLQHSLPAASPLVVTDLRFGGIPWTSGAPRGGAVPLVRVDGAYVDAAAYAGTGWTVSRYAAANSAFGFDALWTPSDSYGGWITLWQVGVTALNITQVGGHGVSLNSTFVRSYAGTVVVVLGDGLYINGTKRVSIPLGSVASNFTLLPSALGGLRAMVRYAWLDAGMIYNEWYVFYNRFTGTRYTPSTSPSPWAYFVDFRWWPPVASWGILQNPPITAVRQRPPGQRLTPVLVSGAAQVSGSLWGPFGEVCLAQNSVAFGVRHVWVGPSPPTCVLPAAYTAAGSVKTDLFNATAPVQLYFASPPIQHPYAANSVPGARFCSLNATHFAAPYLPLPVRAPGSTVVADQWACAPSDYFVGGHVGQSAPGWALIVPVMRVFRVNTTSVVYLGSGSAVLARGGAVPALSVRAVDGRTWSIYTSGAGAVASAGPLQTPPNVSRTGGAVSGVFGAPRSPTTLVSQWWADGVRYYISAAGLADAPVVYISSFTGSPVAVAAELNAPGGYSYYVGILDNGTYVWAVPLTGPMQFSVYVPAPGYYEVRLYREADKVWGKNAYLSPDTKLMIGPVDIPVFTPVNPVSLHTPAAPKPPVFVPVVSMQMPPHAVGVLMLGIFAAAYVTMREVSLAALITGAVVAALGVLINAPIYGVAGVFLLAFGLWNKSRRQGSS